MIHKKLEYLCSERLNSVLRSSHIEEFNWDILMDELRKLSPMYFAITQGCAKTKTPRQNMLQL